MIRRFLLALFLLIVAAPAVTQPREPEWRQAAEEQILIRLNAIEPQTLTLEAGRPTRLVFYNNTRTRLSLNAEGFFSSARIRSGDSEAIRGGGLVLDAGETRAITLVPVEGRYRMRSRSWFRRLIGMSALIVVEHAGTVRVYGS